MANDNLPVSMGFPPQANPYQQAAQQRMMDAPPQGNTIMQFWDLLSGESFRRQNDVKALHQRAADISGKQADLQNQTMNYQMKAMDSGMDALARQAEVQNATRAYESLASKLMPGYDGPAPTEEEWQDSGAIYDGGVLPGMPWVEMPRKVQTFNDMYGGALTQENFKYQPSVYNKYANMPVSKYKEINSAIEAKIEAAQKEQLDYRQAMNVAQEKTVGDRWGALSGLTRLMATSLSAREQMTDPAISMSKSMNPDGYSDFEAAIQRSDDVVNQLLGSGQIPGLRAPNEKITDENRNTKYEEVFAWVQAQMAEEQRKKAEASRVAKEQMAKRKEGSVGSAKTSAPPRPGVSPTGKPTPKPTRTPTPIPKPQTISDAKPAEALVDVIRISDGARGRLPESRVDEALASGVYKLAE